MKLPHLLAAALLVVSSPLVVQDALAVQEDGAEAPSKPMPAPVSYQRTKSIQLADGTLRYRATAKTTLLRTDAGMPEAEFFSFTYERLPDARGGDDTPDPSRPVTFVFNGGPGSASVWLHMGLVGPKVVQVPSDGDGAGAPPYPVIDNPHTLLTDTDLVLIDPIGTGFSRVVGEGDTADHWGVDEDARSVARFIRRWISDNKRWASPKYILGESYGGIRGPLLVRELQSGFNSVALNGLIMVSPAFDMEVVDGQPSDAAFATVLPTYAATAWYHGALKARPAELDAFLDEVRRFTAEEYVPALFAGRALSEERRSQIAGRLAAYTGLDQEYIERANLRVSTDRFRRELLRDRGLVVGRLDTRYTGTERDDVGEVPTHDPLGDGIAGAYVAGFHQYVQGELGLRMSRDYVVMSPDAGSDWKRQEEDWPASGGYLDVIPHVDRGMAANPDLRLFVANGLYDIATTFHAAENNIARATMDLDRVTIRNYPAGHMMYVHHPTLEQMAKDLRAFIGAKDSKR